MAGSKSDYLEDELLDLVLGDGDFSRPSPVYVALYTVAPTDVGGGTEVSTSGTAYARASVTNNLTNWPDATNGAKSNGAAINYVQATASWGEVVAFAIFDALTGGNMLYWGDISPTKTIGVGDTASFAIGAIDITED